MGVSVDGVAFDEWDTSDIESIALSPEKPVEIASSIEQNCRNRFEH